MRIAAFENEPDAQATAILLAEQGYTSEVSFRDDDDYNDRMKRFFTGEIVDEEPHAVLVCEDADETTFLHAVRLHHGSVIRGEA